MGTTIRFGVSLDSDLLEKFDALCSERAYQNRSEAIRDLIRNTLVRQEWENNASDVAATLMRELRRMQDEPNSISK